MVLEIEQEGAVLLQEAPVLDQHVLPIAVVVRARPMRGPGREAEGGDRQDIAIDPDDAVGDGPPGPVGTAGMVLDGVKRRPGTAGEIGGQRRAVGKQFRPQAALRIGRPDDDRVVEAGLDPVDRLVDMAGVAGDPFGARKDDVVAPAMDPVVRLAAQRQGLAGMVQDRAGGVRQQAVESLEKIGGPIVVEGEIAQYGVGLRVAKRFRETLGIKDAMREGDPGEIELACVVGAAQRVGDAWLLHRRDAVRHEVGEREQPQFRRVVGVDGDDRKTVDGGQRYPARFLAPADGVEPGARLHQQFHVRVARIDQVDQYGGGFGLGADLVQDVAMVRRCAAVARPRLRRRQIAS
ncbi:MAG: hypothetical protein RLO50_20920 [Azospirillaceae bacterium]